VEPISITDGHSKGPELPVWGVSEPQVAVGSRKLGKEVRRRAPSPPDRRPLPFDGFEDARVVGQGFLHGSFQRQSAGAVGRRFAPDAEATFGRPRALDRKSHEDQQTEDLGER